MKTLVMLSLYQQYLICIMFYLCVYILVTKHDIFQINTSLIRQNSEISRFSTKVSETPKPCEKNSENLCKTGKSTCQTRLRDMTQNRRDFETILKFSETQDFKGTIHHSQIKARQNSGHSRLNVQCSYDDPSNDRWSTLNSYAPQI